MDLHTMCHADSVFLLLCRYAQSELSYIEWFCIDLLIRSLRPSLTRSSTILSLFLPIISLFPLGHVLHSRNFPYWATASTPLHAALSLHFLVQITSVESSLMTLLLLYTNNENLSCQCEPLTCFKCEIRLECVGAHVRRVQNTKLWQRCEVSLSQLFLCGLESFVSPFTSFCIEFCIDFIFKQNGRRKNLHCHQAWRCSERIGT